MKAQVNDHMANVGQPTKEGDKVTVNGAGDIDGEYTIGSTGSSEPDPNADWYAKIDDEIAPGINACKSMAEITAFIGENGAFIKALPQVVGPYIDDLIGKRIKAIGNK